MLNNKQIEFLAKISDIDTYTYDNTIIGVLNRKHTSVCIKYPYEDFKKNMGLEDIRFNWMTNDKVFISGGTVLNWVWGENKNEDYDMFFTSEEAAHNFALFITNYGFEQTRDTKYALTFFNEEESLILQIVGGSKEKGSKNKADFNGFIPFGTPEETIKRFDIELCKFAVDGDFVYFTVGAITNLISKFLRTSEKKYNTADRLFKYNRKGFFIPSKEEQPEDVSSGAWY